MQIFLVVDDEISREQLRAFGFCGHCEHRLRFCKLVTDFECGAVGICRPAEIQSACETLPANPAMAICDGRVVGRWKINLGNIDVIGGS